MNGEPAEPHLPIHEATKPETVEDLDFQVGRRFISISVGFMLAARYREQVLCCTPQFRISGSSFCRRRLNFQVQHFCQR